VLGKVKSVCGFIVWKNEAAVGNFNPENSSALRVKNLTVFPSMPVWKTYPFGIMNKKMSCVTGMVVAQSWHRLK
jgi:hypothetical protein